MFSTKTHPALIAEHDFLLIGTICRLVDPGGRRLEGTQRVLHQGWAYPPPRVSPFKELSTSIKPQALENIVTETMINNPTGDIGVRRTSLWNESTYWVRLRYRYHT